MYIDSVFHTPDEAELASPLYLTWAGHRVCRPNHSIGPRVLPNYKMVLVVEGSGFFRLNGQDRLIRAGDLFFCFPDVIHHYFANSGDPWTIKWFSFNGNSCAQIISEYGTPIQSMMLTGGGARSGLWPDILAAVFGMSTQVHRAPGECTSLGAAMLAGVGAGIFSSYEDAASVVKTRSSHQVNPAWKQAYEESYAVYRDIYEHIHDLNDRIARFGAGV